MNECYDTSSYVHYGNNPVNRTDPTGMEWKTQEDSIYASSLSQAMQQKVATETSLLNKMAGEYKMAFGSGNTVKAKELMSQIAQLGELISCMNAGIAELQAMGSTKEQVFTYNKIDGNIGSAGKDENGVVVMDIANNGSISNGIHESSHGYDLWKNGRYTINKGGNYIDGEVKAYSRQFSYDSSTLPTSDFGTANTLHDIDFRWVSGIQLNGEYIYLKRMYPNRNAKDILKLMK